MHADELLLQQTLTAEVRYGRTIEELQDILRAVGAKPNLEQQKMKNLFYIIATTEERRI